jgi:hypothetical protein
MTAFALLVIAILRICHNKTTWLYVRFHKINSSDTF